MRTPVRGQQRRPALGEARVHPRGVFKEHCLVVVPATDPRLIGDHDHQIATRMRLSDEFEHTRHPVCQGGCMHVSVIDVDDTIAIQEQRATRG